MDLFFNVIVKPAAAFFARGTRPAPFFSGGGRPVLVFPQFGMKSFQEMEHDIQTHHIGQGKRSNGMIGAQSDGAVDILGRCDLRYACSLNTRTQYTYILDSHDRISSHPNPSMPLL